MARIRTIKPAFFRHSDLFQAEQETGLPLRVAFAGLWTAADREGRFPWRPLELKLDCLPYDDVDFSRVLDALTTRGFLVRYASEDGREYGAIPSWRKHQVINNREAASEIPAPVNVDAPATSTRDPRVDDACPTPLVHAQAEGKGREGNGKEQEGKGTDSALRARFERFWAEFPRKVGKDAAWALWQRRQPDDALTGVMVAAVREQARSPQWRRDGGQFIPHPRTWLHQGRWQDTVDRAGLVSDGLDGLREAVRHG